MSVCNGIITLLLLLLLFGILALSGPYGPLLARSGSQEKIHISYRPKSSKNLSFILTLKVRALRKCSYVAGNNFMQISTDLWNRNGFCVAGINFRRVWTICATGKALMLPESILCEFGQICVTGNALMQLKFILCQFGQICVTRNALMLLESILCKFGHICATENALVLLESLLCEFGQICATGNALMLLESILCKF